MSTEENKALVRRFYDQAVTRDAAGAIDELVALGFAFARPGPRPGGRAGLAEFIAHGRAMFPDLRVVADELIADGDRVVARWTATGTHTGAPYHGVPATGKAASEVGVDIWRLADGQLAELWCLGDGLGLRRQLGLLADDQEGTEDAEAALLGVLDRLADALARQDGAAAAALFAPDPDTLLVGSAVGELARGIAAVRELLAAITATWRIAFTWDWRTASAAGPVAWLMAEGTCSGTFDGQEFSVPYRMSMVLERRGGTWLVRQLHGSEPSTTGQ